MDGCLLAELTVPDLDVLIGTSCRQHEQFAQFVTTYRNDFFSMGLALDLEQFVVGIY